MIDNNMPETTISKSYTSTINYDNNGRQHQEVFQSHSLKQIDKEGKKIQENKKAYKNTSTGVEKVAHEKILDNIGYKIIKERNINSEDNVEEHIYKGIGEEDLPNFNNRFDDYKQRRNLYRNNNILGNNRNEDDNRNRCKYPYLDNGESNLNKNSLDFNKNYKTNQSNTNNNHFHHENINNNNKNDKKINNPKHRNFQNLNKQ